MNIRKHSLWILLLGLVIIGLVRPVGSEAVMNLGIVNQRGEHVPIRVTVGGREAIFMHLGADAEGNAMFRVMASRLDFDDDVTITIKARAVATR